MYSGNFRSAIKHLTVIQGLSRKFRLTIFPHDVILDRDSQNFSGKMDTCAVCMPEIQKKMCYGIHLNMIHLSRYVYHHWSSQQFDTHLSRWFDVSIWSLMMCLKSLSCVYEWMHVGLLPMFHIEHSLKMQ